jgi:hypothetical protein
MLAALGSVAVGGATAVSTGAFTSVSAARSVSVKVADDSDALVGLVAGDTEFVRQAGDGTLEIDLDGTGTPAEGVNFDAVTQVGDPENPEDDHAFKLINRGTRSLMFKLSYYFTATDWLAGGEGQSFLRFSVFDTGDPPTGVRSQAFPIQNGYNRDYPLGQPTGSEFGSNTSDYRFNVGEEYYVVIEVDTTGPAASLDDDLSGVAEVVVSPETSGGGYDRRDPPL